MPETLFDLDFAGHYLRRIKSVAITIPCVTGPYTGIPCTLTLLRNSIRQRNTLRGAEYRRDPNNEDLRFIDSFGVIQTIVTSSAQSDSGLFEPNLRDERYLPFEGAGAISDWRIELPPRTQPAQNPPAPSSWTPFDYDTITDVVLHIRYTAREAGGLRARCRQDLTAAVNALLPAGARLGANPELVRLFSVRHEFPSAFHQFSQPPAAGQRHRLALDLSIGRFPFLFQNKNLSFNGFVFLVKLTDSAPPALAGELRVAFGLEGAAPTNAIAGGNLHSLRRWNIELQPAAPVPRERLAGVPGTHRFEAWRDVANVVEPIPPHSIENILVACRFTVA